MSKKLLSQQIFEQTADGLPDNWEEINVELLVTEEELLPELVAAIDGHMIHHPLLVTHATPTAHNNFLLLVRKKRVEESEQEGNWFKYIFTHERPYQVDAFKKVMSKMDDGSYWKLLASVYIESENLRQNQGSIRQLLTSDRPQREDLMDEDERKVLDDLPEVVAVFRGYGFDNAHGWSWTISCEKADWFSTRFAKELGGVSRVATGTVKKTDIIAYFDGRNEKEIVCDPKCVADIKTKRLDGKEDKPRIPREHKLGFDSHAGFLKMHMKQFPTMTIFEFWSALEFMHEELDTLIEQHGGETLCGDINADSVDSKLLKIELEGMSNSDLDESFGCVEDAYQDLEPLIREHGGETLCGDFDLT